MKTTLALFAGLLFGAGIMVAGVFEPRVIVGALNVFGAWDPTLYIAMIAGSGTFALIRMAVRRRSAPFAAEAFSEPTNRRVDRKLVLGASLFGATWGFSGFCPGLALVNLGAGGPQALFYLLALAVGIALADPVYEAMQTTHRRFVGATEGGR